MFYAQAHLPVIHGEHYQNQPTCPECGQHEFKPALNTDQARTLALKGLFEDVYLQWPDVIFFVSGFWITKDMLRVLRSRGHKTVILHTESPYQDREQIDRGQYADINLLNDPTNLDEWRSVLPNTWYMPHAYDRDVHYPATLPRAYESDFSFIGTGFQSRRDFFGKLDLEGLEVTLGGPNWGKALEEPENSHIVSWVGHDPEESVDNTEAARLYRMSKVGINFYRREGEKDYNGTGWAMGPREIEMAACELFFIRDSRPESDEVFGHILPSYSTPEEASELIQWWATHDKEREHAAQVARQAIEDRTFDNNARQFMRYLESL